MDISTIASFGNVLISGFALQWYSLVLFFIVTIGLIGNLRIEIRRKKTFPSFFTRFFYKLLPFLLLLLLAILAVYGIQSPAIKSPQLPLFDPISVTRESPLVIRFDRQISKRIQGNIVPSVKGEWKLDTSTGYLPYNELRFYPDEPLQLNTEYIVDLTNVKSFADFSLTHATRVSFMLNTSPAHPTTGVQAPMVTPIRLKQEAFAVEISLTPTPNTTSFTLNVPQYKQQHTFTCFSASAKMALGYRRVEIDEIGFLHEIGFDQTPRNFVTNTWGDPNKAVVGTFNGSGDGGYGVHWDPVANTMNKYRKTEVKRNWTIPEMLQKVEEGNPVMVWWINGVWPAKDVSWNLPGGNKVYTVNGMHVEVVVGWIGDRNDPTYILTNDPWRGRRQYTQGQFNNLWGWFSNTGVVVY